MDSHLILWRHAEASIGIKDINRDLTEKGKLDGKEIAELLAKNYTNMSLFLFKCYQNNKYIELFG